LEDLSSGATVILACSKGAVGENKDMTCLLKATGECQYAKLKTSEYTHARGYRRINWGKNINANVLTANTYGDVENMDKGLSQSNIEIRSERT